MKRTGNANNRVNNYILLFGMLAQLLLVTTGSPVYGGFDRAQVYKACRAAIRAMPLSQANGRLGFFLLANDNRLVDEIETDRYYLTNFPGYKTGNQLYKQLYLLSVPGLSVIILFFGQVIIRNSRYRELIAYRLGGHAPPVPASLTA